MTMQFIITVLLSQILWVVAIPAGAADVEYSISTNVTHYTRYRTLANGTTISENATIHDGRFSENWQYNDTECKWVMSYMPYMSSECTEYCEADSYNWGYRYHRLRYHIKLSANGQDVATWCNNFKARMMYNCGVGNPDFFNCNSGRAQEWLGLRTWIVDASIGQVVQKIGINLRFDFSPWWQPRDAMHDCVRSAIREATCAGTIFRSGLRCIPTMYISPSGSPEFDESYVPPASRCLYNSEVPPEAT
ncbi:hypothetical protein F5B19DRAFT_425857 [Rostrohypoxylon terebratum]|nr:hypothetical protein F5B19DRAFT_425857 [Rostrohypoxylon terebratum]